MHKTGGQYFDVGDESGIGTVLLLAEQRQPRVTECGNSFLPFARGDASNPELHNGKRTSLSPGDIRACLRLKVCDPEAGAMIGIRDSPEVSIVPA